MLSSRRVSDGFRKKNTILVTSIMKISSLIINQERPEERSPWVGCEHSVNPHDTGGERLRSWLRQRATSRKVAGSIPDGVIGIFHWRNHSGRTRALGSTHSLTEMSTRNISWGVKVAGAKGWQPYFFMCRLSWNLGASTSWNPQGLSRPVMVLFYLYLYHVKT